ncbi:MAG: YqeG family HAD IIIA-type phosphatase [Oscillospiraceae bacterium]|nr:YqeG family HAD IIIA-type phosphatase [Oscillospiraceae bacterium]
MRLSPLPNIITDNVTDLKPEWLQRKGIKLLMLDFDNTLVPYTTNIPSQEVESWLQEMLASPIRLCVVSNSRKDRVKVFCQAYGLDCITHAKKPFSKGIEECLARYEIPRENCGLAGDQIYTDVLGANSAGVQSFLIKAIDNHNFWLKARHVLERPWIYIARKRRLDYEKY